MPVAKRFLPALLLSVAASAAGAQTSTATLTVNAKVQSAVTLASEQALDFGAGIVPGTATTIAPSAGGRMKVSYNVPTTVTLPNTVTLNRTGGGSVSVGLTCAQANNNAATAPTVFATDCATGYSTALVSNAPTSWWVYLGGSIAAAATTSAPAGTYTNTVTVTANYVTY